MYTVKSHPTVYRGVKFRSRLEARWAAFFDIAGWKWEYEPIDLTNWTPDFRVEFSCGHSDCCGSHTLLVEVKPYYTVKEFDGHPCLEYPYGGYAEDEGGIGFIPANASAAFGINPSVTYWEMSHGSGGGVEEIDNWVLGDIEGMWKQAGNIVQWKHK